MNNIEFLKFDLTPTEKHIGIATIRYERKIILRFKIMQNPKGEGYFMNAPALKIEEQYYPAFTFDSSYEADQIKSFVLSNVKQALQGKAQEHPVYTDPFATSLPPPEPQQQFNFNEPTPF